MNQDAKNSILLWVGTLLLFGLVWASFQYDIVPHIPDRWRDTLLILPIGFHVVRWAWSYIRKRKADVR